jgi:hypothetical protein
MKFIKTQLEKKSEKKTCLLEFLKDLQRIYFFHIN